MKICPKCKIQKSEDCFDNNTNGRCRECRVYDNAIYNPKNNPLRRPGHSSWPHSALDHYEHQFEIQAGTCAICHRKKVLVRDHYHLTNTDADRYNPICWRGMLCKLCNRVLGLIECHSTNDYTLINKEPFLFYIEYWQEYHRNEEAQALAKGEQPVPNTIHYEKKQHTYATNRFPTCHIGFNGLMDDIQNVYYIRPYYQLCGPLPNYFTLACDNEK